jgi:CheY-like chemotaxis protein
VKHMALLLEDLLDVSRITRGKLELRRSRIDLRAAVDAAVETARPHLEDKSHRLTVDLPDEPVHLDADALRLAQVVTNLLTNAARYTEPGGEIRLSAEPGRTKVTIGVEDTGMGIAPDHLERIFEMFSQGHNRAAQGGGLGIGLALARGIAQLHGGTLSASSPGPGRGSTFTLTLPLAGQLGAAVHEPALMPADPVPPQRILVADDNRDAADTLVSLLRLSGHQVWVAYDGEAALREYEARRPGVVLLDIGMPGVSGYEVARRIRRTGASRDTTLLIALTGWGQSKDKANAAGAGFDHHLTKPVDVPALFKLLRMRDRRQAAANE